jgi:hypothetical protein
VKSQIEEMVFGFMDERDLDELILQCILLGRSLSGLKTTVTNVLVLQVSAGSPEWLSSEQPGLQLLDATAFGRFKVLFADASPKTIPEAIRVATKIVKELSERPQQWVEHLDCTYQEITDVKGEGTHFLAD